ncbi:tyrosine-type recombinase/integrase [Arcanobacterium urinimassiliense]|uniref:tyrosine-type recombinase/integrase n=1 Tax=Arcanobacterium urinimassiliense TaxID=1871014 RepID=UPI00093BC2CA|nr:site-specific integrase [Arcanobacterium urinimassiliense]
MPRKIKLPKGITQQKLKDGTIKYRVRLSVESRDYHIGNYDSVAAAKIAQDREKGDLARGIWKPPAQRKKERKAQEKAQEEQNITVNEWAEQWLKEQEDKAKAGLLSLATPKTRKSLIKTNIAPYIGNKRLIDVTREDIERLVKEIDSKPAKNIKNARGNGSSGNVISCLKSLFNEAVKRNIGGLTVSPAVTVKCRPSKRVKVLAEGENYADAVEVVYIAYAMPENLKIAVMLAYWCSLRLGEVLGLQRQDLTNLDTPENARINIVRQWNKKAGGFTTPKSDSARSIVIPSNLIPDLIEHLDKYVDDNPEALLFARTSRKEPVAESTFRRHWNKARETIGKNNLRFHDLRACGLTQYAQVNADLKSLLNRGGHKDVEVAMRYQRSASARDRELTKAMDKKIISLTDFKEQMEKVPDINARTQGKGAI